MIYIPWSFVKDIPSSKSSSQLSSCSSGACSTNVIGSRIFSTNASGPAEGLIFEIDEPGPSLNADVEGCSMPEVDAWSIEAPVGSVGDRGGEC